MENIAQMIEAILFTSGTERKKSELLSMLPELNSQKLKKIIEVLKEKYNEDSSGVVLLEFNDKLQLSTNTKYGGQIAEFLTPLKEKELSKVLLEVLSIVAYKQPITKLEVEHIKSTSAEYAISALLKANLIYVMGRKDVVGRPVLYGTTDEFLKKFQLENISQLPDYQTVMDKLQLYDQYHKPQEGLYRDLDIESQWDTQEQSIEDIERNRRLQEIDRSIDKSSIIDKMLEDDEDDIPDFLKNEDIKIYQS